MIEKVADFQVLCALREAKTWLLTSEIVERTRLSETSVRRALRAMLRTTRRIEKALAKDVYDMPCFVRGSAYRLKGAS